MIKIVYILECRHATVAPSTIVNGPLRCPFNHGWSTIVGVHVHEWRARCDACAFSRWAGLVKDTATIFAKGHESRNRGHECKVEYVVNPEAERTLEKMKAYKSGAVRSS